MENKEKKGFLSGSNISYNILLWNVRGLQKRHKDISALLKKENVDICLVCNTRLSHRNQIQFEGYKTFRTDNPKSGCFGGTALLVRRELAGNFRRLPSYSDEIIQSTIIFDEGIKTGVGVMYVQQTEESRFVDSLGICGLPFIFGASFNHRRKPCLTGLSINDECDDLLNGRKLFPLIPKTHTFFSNSSCKNASKKSRTLDFFISNVNYKNYELEVCDQTDKVYNQPVLLKFQPDNFLQVFNNSMNKSRGQFKNEPKEEVVVKEENGITKRANDGPAPVRKKNDVVIIDLCWESEEEKMSETRSSAVGAENSEVKRAKTSHYTGGQPLSANRSIDSRTENNLDQYRPSCSSWRRFSQKEDRRTEFNPNFFEEDTVPAPH